MNQKSKTEDKKIEKTDEFNYVKSFGILQIILIPLLLNPWVEAFSWAAAFILGMEILAICFWAFPVFLYQLVIKRCSCRMSFRIAVKSIVDVLTSPGMQF